MYLFLAFQTSFYGLYSKTFQKILTPPRVLHCTCWEGGGGIREPPPPGPQAKLNGLQSLNGSLP